MKILVACEESQAVTIELRKLGHEAYSCDLLECSGGHPEWHLHCDAIELLKMKWDMIIAFPPCTYMTNASACRMYPKKGILDEERYKKGLEAKEFFMKFYNADCPRIAIENPRPLKIIDLPIETQRIQPYEYGEPYTKLTYLWLKGLPKLKPTKIVTENIKPFVNAGSFSSNGKKRKNVGVKHSSIQRAKTFPGIAKAMAEQWTISDEIKQKEVNDGTLY